MRKHDILGWILLIGSFFTEDVSLQLGMRSMALGFFAGSLYIQWKEKKVDGNKKD